MTSFTFRGTLAPEGGCKKNRRGKFVSTVRLLSQDFIAGIFHFISYN